MLIDALFLILSSKFGVSSNSMTQVKLGGAGPSRGIHLLHCPKTDPGKPQGKACAENREETLAP